MHNRAELTIFGNEKGIKLRLSGKLLAIPLLILALPGQAADDLVPQGAKATLTVDYIYESAGSKRSEGLYDPYTWKVKRTAHIVTDLVATSPTAMSQMQAMDASQTAELEAQQSQAQSIATDMQPMMMDAEKIMEKCGDDEDCITREAMNMAASMQGTPQMDTAMQAKKDAEALATPGTPRYQGWQSIGDKGTYLIEESVDVSVPDPICMGHPGDRCTRKETRQGGGNIPVPPGVTPISATNPGLMVAEVDASERVIAIALPTPFMPLPYTETIVTDEPEGTHDTPTPKGPQQKQLRFRVYGDSITYDKPLVVALKPGVKQQSGEQVQQLQGSFGDAGKLIARWSFVMQ